MGCLLACQLLVDDIDVNVYVIRLQCGLVGVGGANVRDDGWPVAL